MPLNRYSRSLMTQYRCAVLPLNIETGRFRGKKENEHICEMCEEGLIESEMHFVMECKAYEELRLSLFQSVNNYNSMNKNELKIMLMQNFHKAVITYLERAWNKRNNNLYRSVVS